MNDGIAVRILGDANPFSRTGRGIGYHVSAGGHSFLVDCGAPVFRVIDPAELKKISGVIITHCHDDHKRWFTDLAIFCKYSPESPGKLNLITSEGVNEELAKASGPALDRSLNQDSDKVVDIPYDQYVVHRTLGPRALYRITSKYEGGGRYGMYVADRAGDPVGPDRAKIVISVKTGRPRLLFKDPEYGEWIEPESFYPFSSGVFYEEDGNSPGVFGAVRVEAVKSPVWHGVTSIGVKFSTGRETLVLSSDTVHDPELWKRLYSEKRDRRLNISKKEFEAASVVTGDINDYIERVWSEERYRDAIRAFDDAVVIHDISVNNGAVHTHYRKLKNTRLRKNSTILTHAPDNMTSEWVMTGREKKFMIRENRFYEIVDGNTCHPDADIYHKEGGKYFAGYRNDNGKYFIFEHDGIIRVSSGNGQGTFLFRVDLYEDISGKYFPRLEDPGAYYSERRDGRVELVSVSAEGSIGKIVRDCRPGLAGLAGPVKNRELPVE